MKYYFFSIIIPVYNDRENLEVCLKAVNKIDYPQELYEVIIVDNNSTDKPVELKKKFPFFNWRLEKKPGSYAARNKGIGYAKGEIIAFIDADCRPAKNWLKEANRYFTGDEKLAAVAGKIDFVFQKEKPNIFEYIDSARFLDQKAYVEEGYAATANLFIRKRVFSRLGMFMSELISGGDYEFTRRLTESGSKLVYADKAVVFHKARQSWLELRNKTKRTASGHKALKKKKLWQSDISFLRMMLPKKSIAHNPCFRSFDLIEKVKIFIYFNLLHYLSIYYRYL